MVYDRWSQANLAAISAKPLGLDQEAEVYGAAYAVAPTQADREGIYSWQENLARGGGIYEIQVGNDALSGDLEIIAPVDAYNEAGPSSSCLGTPDGAVISGWNSDEIRWEPIEGGSTSNAPADSNTFQSSVNLTLDPNQALDFGINRIDATTSITLYTVGFDVSAPVITPTLSTGDVISKLPSPFAKISDLESGIGLINGATLTIAGINIPVVYDLESSELRIAPENQSIPSEGSAEIVITVTDGFCNMSQSRFSITLDPDAPPKIDRMRLIIPYLEQG